MFQFSIRELVLVTLVVATLLAWRVDRRQQASDVRYLLDMLRHEAPWFVDYERAPKWVIDDLKKQSQEERDLFRKNGLRIEPSQPPTAF